jgi:serine protease Do
MITTPLMTNTSAQIASELAAVALELQRCTVQVQSGRMGVGSGVIWHSDGLIVTNAHVAQDERVVVELSDGRVMDALRTRIDVRRDLAALQVNAIDLPAVTVADSNALRVGELVLAVGNPQGVFGALTTGIIHEIDRENFGHKPPDSSVGTIQNPKSKIQNPNNPTNTQSRQRWVMADIRLAPGNSGGCLANARGGVIGINTMIAGGLALAVPSNEVEHFLKGGNRPYLGVTLRPVQVLNLNRHFLGLLVLQVAQDSLARLAGLMVGDVLIGVCGQSFNTPDDLLNVLEHAEPGQSLPLEFLRNGKPCYCTVVLHPDSNVAPPIVAEV